MIRKGDALFYVYTTVFEYCILGLSDIALDVVLSVFESAFNLCSQT